MKQEDFLYLHHFSTQRTHSQKPAFESYSESDRILLPEQDMVMPTRKKVGEVFESLEHGNNIIHGSTSTHK
jgi:hypothetical protein